MIMIDVGTYCKRAETSKRKNCELKGNIGIVKKKTRSDIGVCCCAILGIYISWNVDMNPHHSKSNSCTHGNNFIPIFVPLQCWCTIIFLCKTACRK